ncbi:MAG: PEP-CTERM sorting domain-containing protein [Gemmataceae bacterium]|nr:PEP-CTERM sorting domain-containing protein [Gemmata sp.]MDW8198329.1 PEP-CTERM sorting domain-containing protein [Gemmataceae bacterium]
MLVRFFTVTMMIGSAATMAWAAPITTLFSTGQGQVGGIDPNYRITQAVGGLPGFSYTAGGNAYIFSTPDGTYPISNGVWALNSYNPPGYPMSRWIGPSVHAEQNWLHSFWVYETTFDLTGYDPSTAIISGAIAADNAVEIYLNGEMTGYYFSYPGDRAYVTDAFNTQTFTLTSGFVAGLNTLTFYVRNGNPCNDRSAPTGLRVALSGTAEWLAEAEASPVTPEPATVVVFGVGAMGIAGYLRRRRVAG